MGVAVNGDKYLNAKDKVQQDDQDPLPGDRMVDPSPGLEPNGFHLKPPKIKNVCRFYYSQSKQEIDVHWFFGNGCG
jgi:hypothetical protein